MIWGDAGNCSRPYIFQQLYRLGIEETVEKTDCGITLEDANITYLNFADDLVVLLDTWEVFVHTMDTLTI